MSLCYQYPVRKLIQVGDRIEVIYLYKIPVEDEQPVDVLTGEQLLEKTEQDERVIATEERKVLNKDHRKNYRYKK
jgi:hypothetical protein